LNSENLISELKKGMEDAQQEANIYKEEKEKANAIQNDADKQMNDTLAKENSDLKSALSLAEDKHSRDKASFEEEVNRLRSSFDEANIEIQRLNKEKQSFEEQVVAMQAEMKSLQNSMEKTSAANEDKSKEEELIALLREELAAAKAEAEQANQNLKTVNLQAEERQKRDSLDDDETQASSQTIATQELENSIRLLTSRKDDLAAELERMEKDKLAMEQVAKDLEEQKKKHETDKMELQKKVDEAKAKAEAAIQEEKARLEAERIQLEEAKKAHEEEKRLHEEEKRKLEERVSSAVSNQTEEEKAKTEAVLQEQKAALDAERAELEAARKAHEEERRKLEAMKTGLDTQPELTPVTEAPETEHQPAEVQETKNAEDEALGSGSDWIKTTDESGNVYYLNEKTGESQWENPADVPISGHEQSTQDPVQAEGEWIKQLYTDGTEYYLNTVTGDTSWTDPNDAGAEQVPGYDRRDSDGSHATSYSIEL